MVRMDLKYARGWSLWLDIEILLRTPIAVITGNGAH
jgi:lipopolysaccharide/colanic/teichoic acid biosynthesis glycosyltransferase